MMQPAIGLLEFNSVAAGIEAGDAMAKRAIVNLLEARTICPGKYMVLIGGDTGPVLESLDAGLAVAPENLVDQLFLPNVHLSLFPAIAGTVEVEITEAIGVIETVTVAATIIAADAAAKATPIVLQEIRLANGLGGKSFLVMSGTVSDVEASVAAGVNLVKEQGLLIRSVVIPRLHEDMRAKVVG
ncbi:MAG: BMC domain-containing protein [Anaerolineae bacterium]